MRGILFIVASVQMFLAPEPRKRGQYNLCIQWLCPEKEGIFLSGIE